jgi:hypothetical protein
MPTRIPQNAPRTHGLGVRSDAKPQHFDRQPSVSNGPVGGWGPVGPSRLSIINSGEKRTAIADGLSKAFGGAKVVSHPPLPTFHVMQKNQEPVTMKVSEKTLTLTRGEVTAHVAVPKKPTQAAVLKAVEKLAAQFKAAEAAR